jgi:hypothetical protein
VDLPFATKKITPSNPYPMIVVYSLISDVVSLFPGSLQQDIDALDGKKVRVLKICYNGFSSDAPERPTLHRSLRAL